VEASGSVQARTICRPSAVVGTTGKGKMKIDLRTILISMVVAFLLFTADGKEVLGFMFLVASNPLGLFSTPIS
jgi:hypothetical protein